MDNLSRQTNIDKIEFGTLTRENTLLRSSFAWMSLAMLLTAVTAYLFGFMPALTALLIDKTEAGYKPTMLAYVVMFAPILFVMGMSFALNRLSYPALIGLFIAYAIVNGISFSFIFWVYNIGSILTVFLSTT